MPRRLVVMPALALLLAGCGAESPPARGLTADALAGSAAPPPQFAASDAKDPGTVADGWLATFGDAKLNALVAEAMTSNRDLAASKARVDQAAAKARQAGADLKPQVGYSMGASTGQTGSLPRTDQMGAGLTLSWELDVWGRLAAGQRATQEAFASQAADYEFARQSLAAQVAKAWFLAIQAVKQERIAEEFAGLQKTITDLTEMRRVAGRASEYDTALQRSALATSQDQLLQAQSGREQAVRSLEVLLGRYPKADLEVDVELPAMPKPPPAGLPSQLLERRPDLIAATRRVNAAFNQVESAKAARLPRLSITANVGGANSSFKDLSLNQAFWNLAGNLVGPIYDGGRIKEQIAIETATQEEALALYGKAALTAFQQVEKGLAEDRRLADRLTLVQAADKDQGEALRLATLRFNAGTIDQLSLLVVQGQTLNARLAALAVGVERLTNRVDLHLALGGGFEAPPPAPDDLQPASKVVGKGAAADTAKAAP